MSTKNFRSVTSEVKRIALTAGGHIFLIGPEWTPIPECGWPDAYASGCVSEDMGTAGVNVPTELLRSLADENVFQEAIKKALLKAVDDNVVEAFKKDGNPNLMWLRTELAPVIGAANVQSHLVDKVWFKIQNGAM
jgi:hypothetical protein